MKNILVGWILVGTIALGCTGLRDDLREVNDLARTTSDLVEVINGTIVGTDARKKAVDELQRNLVFRMIAITHILGAHKDVDVLYADRIRELKQESVQCSKMFVTTQSIY
ncbi:MAG: hypothetical protein ACRCZ9_01430 [Fusobacteriaceae bacterium]